jgi:hypothetical protein
VPQAIPELWILRYPAHRYHAVPSPGFEPTTLWLRVRRPNHSATTLHYLFFHLGTAQLRRLVFDTLEKPWDTQGESVQKAYRTVLHSERICTGIMYIDESSTDMRISASLPRICGFPRVFHRYADFRIFQVWVPDS